MSVVLSDLEHRVLECLVRLSPGVSVEELVQQLGTDQARIAAVVFDAQKRGWIEVEERQRKELIPSEQGRSGRLPERAFLSDGEEWTALSMQEAAQRAQRLGVKLNEVLKWGGQRGWLKKDAGQIVLAPEGIAARSRPDPDERALELSAKSTRFLEDLESSEGIPAAQVESLLGRRGDVAKLKTRTLRTLQLTPGGREAFESAQVRQLKTQLTSDDITSGAWRNIELKPYDVTLAAETSAPVKMHPFQRMLEEVRRAFLEMGFTEVVSPMVETAFWDFDALYQPQDHPARDMQDTFYLSRPARGGLPDSAIVDRVRQTHENGWETGSTGWGYRWSEEKARQMVLRTHTTATTIRALVENPEAPRKVFCVGRVFRNENITYKHLPEFTQVDGIVIDEQASFATLLGTLREFYRKMGFDRVRFKPEFFPYTEPSAGVFAYMESKQRWIELGGSGVFRPEVTVPLGCKVPVLAWGLGLERLAMQRYGVQDIRTLYWTDLDWLKEVPLCQ